MSNNDASIVLEAKGITKQFPGVLANDRVDLTLRRGEILALLGENGAGKSTLMNVLYGLYTPDAGEIWIKGEHVILQNPGDAIARGVGMVHQHFQLVPVMTVAENVILGSEITKLGGYIDKREANRRVRELSEQYGLEIDPTIEVEDLPVGLQQRVEIIKALYRQADILILDEPTAVLTPQESNELFRIMHDLTEKGVSIIFITHKLKEVLAIADRIVVLRGGRSVGAALPSESTEASLAELMVGRKVILQVDKDEAVPGKLVLEIDGLHVQDDRKHEAVKGLSLQVYAGEILGVAGVQGNGQREFVEALTGLRPSTEGKITIMGEDATHLTPRRITELDVAHIPEDREKHGLVMPYSIADNLVLNRYYRAPYSKNAILDREKIAENGAKLVKQFDVRTPSIYTHASSLSGGNKQKVIVAREFSRPVKLLIANQPTRGIDVGSIEFIHNQIVAQRDAGVAVLLVSAELDEVLSLADRVAVMFDGRIVKTLPIEEATREKIGLLMAGSEA
ncbi:MAG: ABC transporter ATP-binding protein [Anaerolineae bacterium]|uniref:ABC transporter ATP-binding protein n=1 Tax=Promineifilum sp. TaxID=2664178 RepID=UPI001D9F8059|nr:ABC transporter ATP-binding protein [Anaerolineales bacterium]MCB8936141.1 ABC transporter ATP-binding protein [Promineifilum sp.]MCO5182023.1 ABC transporter ATP-binding protein [Promineifilum sp.]MCW5846144.1 ABC transporter ATP-binding protein [Anaerolineae bacterium]